MGILFISDYSMMFDKVKDVVFYELHGQARPRVLFEEKPRRSAYDLTLARGSRNPINNSTTSNSKSQVIDDIKKNNTRILNSYRLNPKNGGK